MELLTAAVLHRSRVGPLCAPHPSRASPLSRLTPLAPHPSRASPLSRITPLAHHPSPALAHHPSRASAITPSLASPLAARTSSLAPQTHAPHPSPLEPQRTLHIGNHSFSGAHQFTKLWLVWGSNRFLAAAAGASCGELVSSCFPNTKRGAVAMNETPFTLRGEGGSARLRLT